MSQVIGKSIPRREDERHLRGKGRYTDDLVCDGAAFAYFLRSPHAHARIVRIETDAARRAPGVLAVLTAEDYGRDGRRPVTHHTVPNDALDGKIQAFGREDSRVLFENPQPVLAQDRVRYVGEPLASVVADTLEQARDAAELISVTYEVLEAVVDPLSAMQDDAPRLWSGLDRNIALDTTRGDRGATESAMQSAFLVLEHEFRNQRIVTCQMEPRSATGSYDAATGQYTLVSGSQGVLRVRDGLAAALGVDKARVRVISPDVGGGFGSRTQLSPEQVFVSWAAEKVGRSVHWRSDRGEAFLSDFQARDQVSRITLAFDQEGRILGLRATHIANIGAHPVAYTPISNGYRILPTVYDVPVASVHLMGVLTNTMPTAPYRGAGRPEATHAMERLLDMAARRLGIDRLEIRRRNIIPRSRLPYTTVMGLTYDSGNFLGNMEDALRLADWHGFPKRKKESLSSGALRGIGLSNYVEAPVGAVRERVSVEVDPGGRISIIAGTQSTGQGHETTFAQVVADRLGAPFEVVDLKTGDTSFVEVGGGTHSDRSMRLAGTLLVRACDELLARARASAAGMLECAGETLRFQDGLFSVSGSNETLDLFDIARSLAPDERLLGKAELGERMPAHPTGCAVCEVEIDRDTGAVAIVRYTAVDDVGQAINPLIVHGQVHGGIAQGVGQALYEHFAVDLGTGQVTGASFMDYGVPRADCLPSFTVALTEDPTQGNPLRVKGGGEGGTTPASGAVINAVVDALGEFGVEDIDMPATPARIWALMHSNGQASRPPSPHESHMIEMRPTLRT
jgi:carbon-monoxide dehydrogenase large subunit